MLVLFTERKKRYFSERKCNMIWNCHFYLAHEKNFESFEMLAMIRISLRMKPFLVDLHT